MNVRPYGNAKLNGKKCMQLSCRCCTVENFTHYERVKEKDREIDDFVLSNHDTEIYPLITNRLSANPLLLSESDFNPGVYLQMTKLRAAGVGLQQSVDVRDKIRSDICTMLSRERYFVHLVDFTVSTYLPNYSLSGLSTGLHLKFRAERYI